MSDLLVENLRKSYQSRDVVQGISLSLKSGEVVGLLGPNGAGKTTTFYMIVGLLASNGGRILLDGKDLSRLPIHLRARMGLSYLPQEASIFRKLTVAENILAVLELQDLNAVERQNRLLKNYWRSFILRTYVTILAYTCQVVRGGALKLPDAWPPTLVLFC